MKQFLIIDIDGTLTNSTERAENYLNSSNKDWDAFYEHCDEDAPIERVCDAVVRLVETGYTPVFLTGRPQRVMDKTLDWLEKYLGDSSSIKDSALIMRHDNDHTPDFIYKSKVYKDILERMGVRPYNTLILEDRKSVVNMWRELGFICFQVAEGNY